MNTKNLKSMSIFLSALMLLSVTGCDTTVKSNSTTQATTSPAETTAVSEKSVEKPKKITAMVDHFSIKEEDGRKEWVEKYEELTGVELDITQPPHNQYHEKISLAFASGDIPDVVELVPSDNIAFLTYATQGALADITELVKNSESMSKANPKIIDGIKINGKLYGYPQDIGNGTATMIRKDWLDNLEMKVPTNYEEYLNMLRAFTLNDPDKNGQNDTKGVTAAGFDSISNNYRYILDFMQDATPDFVYEDGKWVDGFQQPNMVAALERISLAYKEGLIDQDVITNKTTTSVDKFLNGEVGVFAYWAGDWNLNLQNRTQKVTPSAEVITMPAIAEVSYLNRVPAVNSITTASDNVEGVFKYFIEYMHDGGEGQNLFTYGVEGLTYEVVDGKGKFLPLRSNPASNHTRAVLGPVLAIVPIENNVFDVDPIIQNSNNIFQSKMIQSKMPLVTETYLKMSSDIGQERSATFTKIMIGEISIEEGIAKYAQKVNVEFKLEQILTEMNAQQ